jgi:hypothetical protein
VKDVDMGGSCRKHGGDEKVVNISVGKTERKRHLGKYRRRRKDNIKWVLTK